MIIFTPLILFYRHRQTAGVDTEFWALANKIISMAKRWAPVKTGRLRDSLTPLIRYTKTTTSVMIKMEHYGQYQEYGTERCPPHPFIRPALLAHAKIINKMGGRIIFKKDF